MAASQPSSAGGWGRRRPCRSPQPQAPRALRLPEASPAPRPRLRPGPAGFGRGPCPPRGRGASSRRAAAHKPALISFKEDSHSAGIMNDSSSLDFGSISAGGRAPVPAQLCRSGRPAPKAVACRRSHPRLMPAAGLGAAAGGRIANGPGQRPAGPPAAAPPRADGRWQAPAGASSAGIPTHPHAPCPAGSSSRPPPPTPPPLHPAPGAYLHAARRWQPQSPHPVWPVPAGRRPFDSFCAPLELRPPLPAAAAKSIQLLGGGQPQPPSSGGALAVRPDGSDAWTVKKSGRWTVGKKRKVDSGKKGKWKIRKEWKVDNGKWKESAKRKVEKDGKSKLTGDCDSESGCGQAAGART